MADIEYSKLSRQQKLAIFLIVIGPEAAGEVLKHFDDATIEGLCREMSNFPLVPEPVKREALEEFTSIVAQSAMSTAGGLPFAQRSIEIARGGPKATSLLERVGPAQGSAEVIKDIGKMEGNQIYNLIKSEQPQTIAFVLAHLDSAKASQVFALLPAESHEEVIERLGTIESTSVDLVGKIVRNLNRHFEGRARPSFQQSGGVHSAADLIKKLQKETSKSLLTKLEERNAALGAAIRKKLFSFEDLIRLPDPDLQRVLREVDSNNLAISMKSASEALRQKIYGALSKRAAEGLKEEIELLGPMRLKDIETAQDLIIQAVRRLEEEGQVSLDSETATVA